MNKVELILAALAKSESSPSNYSLILEDVSNEFRIPITIGPFEAQSIALHLEQMKTIRPMTHDLFKTTVEALGGKLKEIFIHHMTDKAFHCKMIYEVTEGSPIEVDARTSDAIAMAIRFQAPIYMDATIFKNVGIPVKSESTTLSNKKPLADYTIEELEEYLERVLANEDYKTAVEIRDIIKRKKKG